MRFSKLAAVTGGTVYNTDNVEQSFTGVAIDSRAVKEKQLFVAIRGEVNDGHDFINAAIAAGASGIIAEYAWPGLEHVRGEVPVIAVPSSHEAMLTLAATYRDSLTARMVGITGSNGKTTTKELTYHLLNAVTTDVYRSPGNLNNLFGVPLSLFAVPQKTTVAVMELGISTELEMPRLAQIVRPDLVAITNVGPSHLQFLDSIESVARAKLELVRKADAEVPVIINCDDPILVEHTRAIRRDFITFALDHEADFTVDAMDRQGVDGTIVTIDGHSFKLPLPGRHQASNLLAAYAIVRTLGYKFDDVATESIPLATAPMRGQVVKHGGVTFVTDCYNANPESVKAGLQIFFTLPTSGRRIVVLGDMLELGHEAERYHREVGRLLSTCDFDLAVMVGPLSRQIHDELSAAGKDKSSCRHFEDAASCAAELSRYFREDDLVYVKASRAIGLEAVIDAVGKSEGDT